MARALFARAFDALLHEAAAEVPVGEQTVVGGAEHADVAGSGRTASRKRFFVVQLQPSGLLAALAVRADEGATRAIALQHLPLDLVGNVPAAGLGACVRARCPRLLRLREALLHPVGDQDWCGGS